MDPHVAALIIAAEDVLDVFEYGAFDRAGQPFERHFTARKLRAAIAAVKAVAMEQRRTA